MIPTETERRRELTDTAANVAALLVQYDKRITILEEFNRASISAIKWIGTSMVVLLAASLAQGWFRL